MEKYVQLVLPPPYKQRHTYLLTSSVLAKYNLDTSDLQHQLSNKAEINWTLLSVEMQANLL